MYHFVEFLIEQVNLEEFDRNGWKPIHFACHNGNIRIIKLLVDEFVDSHPNNTLSKVNLTCLTASNKSCLDYTTFRYKITLKEKIEITANTLFKRVINSFVDIKIGKFFKKKH